MKDKNYKIKRVIKLFAIITFPFLMLFLSLLKPKKELFLLLIGSLLNLFCVAANNWRMPSYHGGRDYIHVEYINKKNIRLWLLSDFIYIVIPLFKNKQKNLGLIVSLGDILMALGILITFLNLF